MLKLLPLIVFLTLTACTPHKTQEDEQDNFTVNHIIIMPVSMAQKISTAATANNLNKGKSILNGLIRDYFKGNKKVSILSESQAESYKQGYDNNGQRIQEIGKRLNADAVMTWQINRYVEKDGGDYSVNYPSSVAFSYRLTDIASGRTLCGTKIDKTQDTLTGNLFSAKQFIHHGGKWISASQLSAEVLQTKLPECRYLSDSKPPTK